MYMKVCANLFRWKELKIKKEELLKQGQYQPKIEV